MQIEQRSTSSRPLDANSEDKCPRWTFTRQMGHSVPCPYFFRVLLVQFPSVLGRNLLLRCIYKCESPTNSAKIRVGNRVIARRTIDGSKKVSARNCFSQRQESGLGW